MISGQIKLFTANLPIQTNLLVMNQSMLFHLMVIYFDKLKYYITTELIYGRRSNQNI